jgi:hypothetical protein
MTKELHMVGATQVLLWAPLDGPTLGRWANTIKEVQKDIPTFMVHLLVQRPLLPGRARPADITDYWQSPLLKGDIGRRIQHISMLEPAVKVIMDGAAGPRLREQHLAIISVGHATEHRELPWPRPAFWLRGAQIPDAVDGVVIDFPREAEDRVKEITKLAFAGISGWSRALPSPSDTEHRRMLIGYTNQPFTSIEAVIVVRDLKTHLSSVPLLAIGHTQMLSDPGALVVDMLGPSSLLAQQDLLEQVIILSPKRAVMITNGAQDRWETIITGHSIAKDEHRITKISWRRSTRGGRVWVMPQTLTENQTAEMVGDWSATSGPGRGCILAQFAGDLLEDPQVVGHMLLFELERVTSVKWILLPSGAQPAPGEVAPSST